MKITVEHSDGSKRVYEGEELNILRSAMNKLWDDYLKREQETKKAFEDLMDTLRKAAE
jgi:hypothetical protein